MSEHRLLTSFLKPGEEYSLEHIREVNDGWKIPEYDVSLQHAWFDFTGALWARTYRLAFYEGCDMDEPHDDCELDLDEHCFDEDGQCIACRRSREYRRRGKRMP